MHFYIPTVLHFGVQLNNSQGDPTENQHLKEWLHYLQVKMCYVVKLHIKVK